MTAETEHHTPNSREDGNTERPANEKKNLALPDVTQTREQTQETSSNTPKPTASKATFTKADVDRHYNPKREQDMLRSREFHLKYEQQPVLLDI